MFGVGMPELMIIFVIALLVFGPKELPKIARTLGKAMAELRRASDDLRDGIQREIDLATREEQPESPPATPEPVPSAESIPMAPGPSPGESPTDVPGAPGAEPMEPQAAGVSGQSEHPEAAEGTQTQVQLTIPALSGEPANGGGAPADSAEPPVAVEAPAEAPSKTETAQTAPVQTAGTRNA